MVEKGPNDTLEPARFESLFERLVGSKVGIDTGRRYFTMLKRRYDENGRCYHSPAHINHCLGCLDRVKNLLDAPDMVEVAIYYHDAIYDTHGNDNEFLSGCMFADHFSPYVPEKTVRRVMSLIMATAHKVTAGPGDEGFICDIDMSSFGLPWDQFLYDSRAVRREFDFLSDAEFAGRQIGFLKRLAGRPTFFVTEYFIRSLEKQAQSNLARQIEYLEQMLAA